MFDLSRWNEEEAWKKKANCAGLDTEFFFAIDGKQFPEIAAVKRICGKCDVRQECLEYAVAYNMRGWWGGASEYERVKKYGQSMGYVEVEV